MQRASPEEGSLCQAIQEVRQELQSCRSALEQQVEEAFRLVRPLAAALADLQAENASLRAKQEQLSRSLKQLRLSRAEEKDPSTLLLESGDPGAHFSGTDEPAEPVAHPPTFSSTRRPSGAHLPRSSNITGAPLPEPPKTSAVPVTNNAAKEKAPRGHLSAEELSKIEEEDVLDKMLDQTTDFEERRLIRAAMRELRQRKRAGGNTFVQTKSSFSSSSKKVGSIFEREDESPGRAGSLAALERRQAEKKKELMKAQSLPKATTSQARKAMIEKMEKEGGSPANPAVSRVAVQRSASFGVPNANSIKQMLLDWCRAKTRGYDHVDIQNFSSSWSDGMAFCALVHNFFPEAFDYAQLSPQDRRRNFEMAFSAAETHAECPQLLDVEDMEFYRCLVQKGLVKTKKS
uniref:Calponin-homology (CH) domain-containing protein n=1 Tax=Anolis carolinensis TaxID=28377 RepID=A0A803U1A5_ANOCA